MNKEQLETNIAALELLVNETTDKSKDFQAQLEQAKKDLANINKPVLTPSQLDDIFGAVERGVEEYDFSDTDNFDIEYGIEYDGKVHCESHEISDTHNLVETIVKRVCDLFVEADCPEDEGFLNEDDSGRRENMTK